MKVYISGPISGTNDYRKRFARIESDLKSTGYDTVNPAEATAHLPEDTTWRTYMGESLRLLCGCDAIYLMWNWDKSQGAKLEYSVAIRLGMPIMVEDKA